LAALATAGPVLGLVAIVEERGEHGVDAEDHAAAASPVAARGPALFDELLAPEGDCAVAPVTGLHEDANLVDELHEKKERAAPWRPFGFKPEGLRSGARPDRDLLAILAERLEGHDALDLGVDGVVAAHAHAVAGVDFGADLPHQDVAGNHALSAVALH